MGRLPHWVEVKDPKAPAVTREAEEDWGKITCSNCGTGSKSRELGLVMSKKRTPDELARLSLTKEQIGRQLRNYYRACTIEELPPQLLTLLKKLDQELPEEQDQ